MDWSARFTPQQRGGAAYRQGLQRWNNPYPYRSRESAEWFRAFDDACAFVMAPDKAATASPSPSADRSAP
jgi:hypothetical protein